MSGLTFRQKFNCSRGGEKVKVKVCLQTAELNSQLTVLFCFLSMKLVRCFCSLSREAIRPPDFLRVKRNTEMNLDLTRAECMYEL